MAKTVGRCCWSLLEADELKKFKKIRNKLDEISARKRTVTFLLTAFLIALFFLPLIIPLLLSAWIAVAAISWSSIAKKKKKLEHESDMMIVLMEERRNHYISEHGHPPPLDTDEASPSIWTCPACEEVKTWTGEPACPDCGIPLQEVDPHRWAL